MHAKKLQSDVDELKIRIARLETNKKLLLIRQLAYSYQYKLSEYVGLPPAPVPRPHGDVSKVAVHDAAVRAKLDIVESKFPKSRYTISTDINNCVKNIRGVGTGNSRPVYEAVDTTAPIDGARIREIIEEVHCKGEITDAQCEIALDILVVIEFMLPSLGNPPLLASK